MVVVVVVVVNPTLQGRVEVRVRVIEGVTMVAMRMILKQKPPQRIAVTKMIQKLMPPQRMDVMVLK